MTGLPALSVTAILLMPAIFSACATVLNGPTQNIRITADEKIRAISVEKSFFIDSVAGEYSVLRTPGGSISRTMAWECWSI